MTKRTIDPKNVSSEDLINSLVAGIRKNPGIDPSIITDELKKRLRPSGTSDPLQPSAQILIKLGSIAVHVEELLSPHGHEFDKVALDNLLADPDIVEWMEKMDKMAFLPVKRNK